MSFYYDKQGKVMPLNTWAKLMEDTNYKRIAFTKVKTVEISTVWLGLDHNFSGTRPTIFETMVFGGKYDELQRRYSTLDQARKGHRRIVALIREKENV